MTQQKPQDELTHYGVKGMRWGARKARTGDLNAHAKPLERVAAGTGGKRDKLYAATRTPLRGLVKNGLKGGAAAEAAKSRAEIKRLSTGKATALDLLKAYGSANLVSLTRAARKKSDFVPNKG